MGLCTIKRSSEFQRVRGGLRAANASFVIETRVRKSVPVAATRDLPTKSDVPITPHRHRPDAGLAALESASCPRFGFTVTRKIGNAVVRNRIRRRFKEALRLLAPGIIAPGHDYVVIARPGVIELPFAELKQILATTITGLHQPRTASAGGDRKRSTGKRASGNPVSAKPGTEMDRSQDRLQKRHPTEPPAGQSKPDRGRT